MLPIEALQKMHVLIATPVFAGLPSVNYATSVSTLMAEAVRFGLEAEQSAWSESLVTRARNTLLAKFLSEPQYTHLFWWDADVGATTAQVFRLLLADRDFAAGVYPIKELAWPEEGTPAGLSRDDYMARYLRYPFELDPESDGTIDSDGFVRIREVAGGFCCMKRSAVEHLVAAYADLWFTPDPRIAKLWPGKVHFRLYESGIDDTPERNYLSEDYMFCKLWRAIGGTMWLDSQSKLSHLGPMMFQGDLAASQRAKGREVVDAKG